jgi:hypothetical protein
VTRADRAAAIAKPQVRVEPIGVAERDAQGWRITWRALNEGQRPLRAVAATAPHSLFRGEMSLDLEVAAQGSASFTLVVRADGTAGDEIENAFVILLVEADAARWRVLARLRVPLGDDGRPEPRVESTTVQRVGFSGEI